MLIRYHDSAGQGLLKEQSTSTDVESSITEYDLKKD